MANRRKSAVFLFWGGLVFLVLVRPGESVGAAPSQWTRTHSGGGVTVSVTYLNPQGTDEARFRVAMDTHSVDLDGYDLARLSSLRDDAGKTYGVSGVENTGGGHHRAIILRFSKPAPEAQAVELTIRDVAGVPERLFRWQIR